MTEEIKEIDSPKDNRTGGVNKSDNIGGGDSDESEGSNIITFVNCKYNHGNKGPSKRGFTLTLSRDPKDWFSDHSGLLICNGFCVEGILFGEKFKFIVENEKKYTMTFENEECTSMDKHGDPTRRYGKLSKDNPQQLLKSMYPQKTLSASAMLAFGSPAIQKIASLLSNKRMDPDKLKNYQDEYYSDARDTLEDFVEDFTNEELKDEYSVGGDWSWDKKTSQKRGKNRKTKGKKKNSSPSTKSSSVEKHVRDNMEYADMLAQKFDKKVEKVELKNVNIQEEEEIGLKFERKLASKKKRERSQITIKENGPIKKKKRTKQANVESSLSSRESSPVLKQLERSPSPVQKLPKRSKRPRSPTPETPESSESSETSETPETLEKTEKAFKFDVDTINLSDYM